MSRPEVSRRDESGDRIAVIHSYAPGDGNLSFVAQDPHTHIATSPSPTREECEAACPYGWILYNNGTDEFPSWRAKRAVETIIAYRCAECGKTGPDHGHYDVTDPATHKFKCGEPIYAPEEASR